MTSIESGTSARFKAPVESITRSEPISNAPGIAGTLPVAMMALSKVIFLPSGIEASSPSSVIVVAFSNFANALTTVTLRFFASPPSPPERVSMTLFFRARSLSSSILGVPKETPHSCSISSVSPMTLATCRSALDGMHPRNRQVPPSFPSASTRTTSIPSSAARNAAAYPPGPPPITTSCVCIRISDKTFE